MRTEEVSDHVALGRAVVGALAFLACLAGCAVDPPTAPTSPPGLVVFGVLDPTGADQVVLLMQSRTTAPSLAGRTFNANDPIVSAGETPVMGAHVVIADVAGDSAVLVEDRVRRSDGLGAGVYRLFGSSAGAPLGAVLAVRAGHEYQLRVHASLGDATGTTRVPTATPAPIAGSTRAIVVGRDSVVLPDIAITGASGFVYTLRAATSLTTEGNAQYRTALEPRLVLPTGDDWAFAYARDRLVVGSRHVLTVQAADSSYFAYYSADTDPFADRSSRTTLRGAAGVFGAVLPVAAVPVLVVLR